MKINGKEHTLNIESDTPLLWAIRDTIGLTGTKYGCGMQQCGACTVLIKDRHVRSCGVTVNEVAGKNITTIEGISTNNSHPVQQAWIDEHVPQCGYCQSGQILTAVALLMRVQNPTDETINRMMTGLCRCGTYSRIHKAIRKAGQMLETNNA